MCTSTYVCMHVLKSNVGLDRSVSITQSFDYVTLILVMRDPAQVHNIHILHNEASEGEITHTRSLSSKADIK